MFLILYLQSEAGREDRHTAFTGGVFVCEMAWPNEGGTTGVDLPSLLGMGGFLFGSFQFAVGGCQLAARETTACRQLRGAQCTKWRMNMVRVFSGIQPTGDSLHLGNYLGAVVGMVELQKAHECIFSVVDYHAITVPYAVRPAHDGEAQRLPQRVLSVAMDYLAAGVDPQRSILMVQSEVPQHTELAWILGCMTTVNKLSQLPTYKDKVARHGVAGLGLLSYPVLMAADILLYKAEVVPVGRDQLPHIEFAREMARTFNHTFAGVFPEPQAHLVAGAVVPSLLGQGAMSKSVPGSYIALTDEPEAIASKLAAAVTDAARQRLRDTGEPTRCNIYALHKLYTAAEPLAGIASACRQATIGCLECKALLARAISESLAPLRERRRQLGGDPSYVHDVLTDGARRASDLAEDTLVEVKGRMGLLRRS